MYVFRMLFLLLLMSVGIFAQSSPDRSSVSPQMDIRGLLLPPEFRAGHVPAASQNGENQIVPFRWVSPPSEASDNEFLSGLMQDSFVEKCYSIETYRVTRDDPHSDITRPAGHSECQTAARFQMKDIGDQAVKP
jgi:hypothetical protein